MNNSLVRYANGCHYIHYNKLYDNISDESLKCKYDPEDLNLFDSKIQSISRCTNLYNKIPEHENQCFSSCTNLYNKIPEHENQCFSRCTTEKTKYLCKYHYNLYLKLYKNS